jgi:hypothetical protein
MSAKRSKTAQQLDEIVSNPKTISDVMIAIDRLNYILSRINSKTLEAEIRVGCAIGAWIPNTGEPMKTNR